SSSTTGTLPGGSGLPADELTRFTLEVDPETSARLGRIRQHGTEPELVLREILRGLGVHYRTRNRRLPGSPDLANVSRRWAIFVHGCYWHHHKGCSRATVPKRNRAFWEAKFRQNRQRDARAIRQLRARGLRVLVFWECDLAKFAAATER